MGEIHAVLLGEDSVHDFTAKAPLIETALGDGVEIERTTDPAVLEDLSAVDVVVDYWTDNSLTDGQVDGLCSFVSDGGGYLPIHCAADLTSYVDESGDLAGRDEPVPALREVIGGHFVGHPEISPFTVRIVGNEHPVTSGVSDFDVVDEPYMVEHDADRVTVLARMDHAELSEPYPVVWTRDVGDGRVCYSSLGHTDSALEHAAHRRLLRNAIRWVADA